MNNISTLTRIPRYNYIKKKEIDDIIQAHGTSVTDRLSMFRKLTKCVTSHAWSAFKHDAKSFYHLRQRQKHDSSPLTHEELRLKKRMRQQLQRIKTLAIIQILPFSGFILMYYIYFFPTLIPSWFTVDSYYYQYQHQIIKNQEQAIKHFTRYPLKINHLTLQQMGLNETKRLSELLFGRYQDGMVKYHKAFPNSIKKEYLMHPHFSKYLVMKNMKKEFKEDIQNHPELKDYSLQQLVVWKYDQVMKGAIKLQVQHIHHHSSVLDQSASHQILKSSSTKNK